MAFPTNSAGSQRLGRSEEMRTPVPTKPPVKNESSRDMAPASRGIQGVHNRDGRLLGAVPFVIVPCFIRFRRSPVPGAPREEATDLPSPLKARPSAKAGYRHLRGFAAPLPAPVFARRGLSDSIP